MRWSTALSASARCTSEAKAEEYQRAFACERFGAVEGMAMSGAVFTLGGRVLGLDAFDKAGTLAKEWPKLVNSYGVEALHTEGAGAVDEASVKAFMGHARDARMFTIDPPGLGIDVRISGDTVVGSALVVDGEPVHLYAFNVEQAEVGRQDEQHISTRMSRYSSRMNRSHEGGGVQS